MCLLLLSSLTRGAAAENSRVQVALINPPATTYYSINNIMPAEGSLFKTKAEYIVSHALSSTLGSVLTTLGLAVLRGSAHFVSDHYQQYWKRTSPQPIQKIITEQDSAIKQLQATNVTLYEKVLEHNTFLNKILTETIKREEQLALSTELLQKLKLTHPDIFSQLLENKQRNARLEELKKTDPEKYARLMAKKNQHLSKKDEIKKTDTTPQPNEQNPKP